MTKKIQFIVKENGAVEVDATEGYRDNECLTDTSCVVETLKSFGIEITTDAIKMVVVAQEVKNDQRVAS